MMGGLLSDSRRTEEVRLVKERQKEESRRKLREEEKKKKAEEAEARKRKRTEEEGEKAKSPPEKKRYAQEALGSRDRAEKVVRFNMTGLPVELDYLYTGGPDFLSPPRDDSPPSDPDVRFAMSAISMLAGYNFLSDAWYASDQKNRKLNTQNGELIAESNQSLEARRKAENEVVKFKDLLDHSQRMNGDLIAEQDVLNSKVAVLTLALAEAEEKKKIEVSRVENEVAELKSSSKDAVARAVGEAKKKAKDKLQRSLEIMKEMSKAQTEVDRLASIASQVFGAIMRMDKAAKQGVPIDVASNKFVLPPLLVDSSNEEGVEPTQNLALDISSTESSDDEAERTKVDGRMTVAGKTPALTRAEIEEAANDEAQDGTDQFELQGGQAEGNADPGGTEEPAATDVVDAATGEPIAPLLSHDANPEEQEQETAPRSCVISMVFM
ncbi:hypothetical protein AALP_AA3G219400 [Arabis alpina]|uniref:Uncharacterized protein n=1 Tax=Arabis alpina TaxID=50452 RepID=A0A087HAU4_ARAAL|nr:hypothetical protein AALP_AA3G219400 [Arabis alpina]